MREGADIPQNQLGEIAANAESTEKAVDSLATKFGGLTEVLSSVGSSMDMLSRNPLLTYAFFDKLNHTWENKYIRNIREATNLHKSQREELERTVRAINISSTAISAFAYNVARAQRDIRKLGYEYNQLATQGQIPGGGSNSMFQMGFDRNIQKAFHSMQYNQEFANKFYETQNKVQAQANFNKMTEEARKNVLEGMTAIGSKYGINVGAGFDSFMRQFRGIEGFDQNVAIGLSTQIARNAGEGRYTAGAPMEVSNVFAQMLSDFKSKGYATEPAIAMTDVSLRQLGQQGLGLSSEKIMQILPRMFTALDYSTEATRGALLGVGEAEYSKRKQQANFPVWVLSKLQGYFGEGGAGAIDDSSLAATGRSNALIRAMGLDPHTARDIAGLDKNKLKELSDQIEKTTMTFDQLRQTANTLTEGKDPEINSLLKDQAKLKSLSDIVSGGYQFVETGLASIPERLGMEPTKVQAGALIAGTLLTKIVASAVMERSMIKAGEAMGRGMLQYTVGTGNFAGGTPIGVGGGSKMSMGARALGFAGKMTPLALMMGYNALESIVNQTSGGGDIDYGTLATDTILNPMNLLPAAYMMGGPLKRGGSEMWNAGNLALRTGGRMSGPLSMGTKLGGGVLGLGMGGLRAYDAYQSFSEGDVSGGIVNTLKSTALTTAGAGALSGNAPLAIIAGAAGLGMELGDIITDLGEDVWWNTEADTDKQKGEHYLKTRLEHINKDLAKYNKGGEYAAMLKGEDPALAESASQYLETLQKDKVAVNKALGRLKGEGGANEPGRLDVVFSSDQGVLGTANVGAGEQQIIRIGMGGIITSP